MEREMDVGVVSKTWPNARRGEKAALLAEAPGVTRLVNVWCHKDPAWSLQLLQRAAPTVERLRAVYICEDHLLAVHDAMPRLRRLDVSGNLDLLDAQPPVQVSALPPGHAGLQWLSMGVLPRATTLSLLQAHGATLGELELWVGTAGSCKFPGWPDSCDDLHSLLQQSGGLRALRRLVLRRYTRCSHEPAACRQQRAEVLEVLPGVEVLCSECDHVEQEEV
ncbi:uncharacterized protein LOC113214277 [Frankliniella occidentalis]|uniref:Uncharacterized protein LOC113214277 n=1 Tax=Frankliniella occidentalis TaxID=133901 RepID=A0A6J1TEU1_FRAOC|nr:uncharacterized protein LOC113214277 [Frankliniella occidentalis]